MSFKAKARKIGTPYFRRGAVVVQMHRNTKYPVWPLRGGSPGIDHEPTRILGIAFVVADTKHGMANTVQRLRATPEVTPQHGLRLVIPILEEPVPVCVGGQEEGEEDRAF
jgi:hypothetical protein